MISYFDVGTIAIVIATLPGIYAVIKGNVDGYSLSQAGLMIIAASSFLVAFWEIENTVSLLAQLPPLGFWSYVLIRKLIQKRESKTD